MSNARICGRFQNIERHCFKVIRATGRRKFSMTILSKFQINKIVFCFYKDKNSSIELIFAFLCRWIARHFSFYSSSPSCCLRKHRLIGTDAEVTTDAEFAIDAVSSLGVASFIVEDFFFVGKLCVNLIVTCHTYKTQHKKLLFHFFWLSRDLCVSLSHSYSVLKD